MGSDYWYIQVDMLSMALRLTQTWETDRTRMLSNFPDGHSAPIPLFGTRLCHVSIGLWGKKISNIKNSTSGKRDAVPDNPGQDDL
jgi:hypothetical protein